MSHRLDNRELIVRAAESAFALQGVHNASLRAINSAAGQRNNASLHYYFKKRINLIDAVLEERAAWVEERRAEHLRALREEGVDAPSLASRELADDEQYETVAGYLDALVGPMADLLEETPQGCYFLIIVQQLVRDPRDYPHPVPGRGDFGTEPELITGLVTALANLPPHLAQLRVRQALLHASHALAQRAQDVLDCPGEESVNDVQMSNTAFVANMTDMILGGLLAPVSRAALEHRDR